MGNCLITQFKESVNNDNLNIFGYMKVKALGTTRFQFNLETGAKIKSVNGPFTITENGVTHQNLTEYVTVQSVNNVLIEPLTEGMVFLMPKYKTKKFLNSSENGSAFNELQANLNDLEFVKLIISITNSNIFGDISKFKLSETISDFIVTHSLDINGSIDNFDVKNLKSLVINGCIGVTGNIQNFNPKNLTNLSFEGTGVTGIIDTFDVTKLTALSVSNTAITGDVKAMAERAWNSGNGRISGYMKLNNVITGESEEKRKWGNQTIYAACGNYNPWIVFSPEGVSLSATQPA